MGTMSKEEILKILEDAKDKNSDVPMRLVRQAFEKLPEPCEDAVSRQAVIELYKKYQPYMAVEVIEFGKALEQLPSAQPERKMGKWNFIGDQMFECTECGACYTQGQFHQMRVRITDSEFPKFCPNCGADMREG